jgi:propanol-preferring alcohol dehydrogenase
MNNATYRAVQITSPGKFELVQRPVTEPGHGKVRIRVEACGVCHTDVVTALGTLPGIQYPRVPGHEVIGRIDAIGSGVAKWEIGQRVGVGFLAGHCGVCESCRRGDYVTCANPAIAGVTFDGGYAEMMIADAHGIAAVPKGFDPAEAAPLVCAGVTTYNAIRHSGAKPGDLVAIQGVGGLGHLGIQFANHMGFRVAAIARGKGKEELARSLGAHDYIDSEVVNPAEVLKELGGATLVLATAADGRSMSALIGGIKPRGKMVVVGVGVDPIQVSTFDLVFGSRSISGSLTGSPIDNEDTLGFSMLEDIRPMIETMPLEQAEEAYNKMMRNEARFRIVLVTGQ